MERDPAVDLIARGCLECDSPEGFGARRFPKSQDTRSLDRGKTSANRRRSDRPDDATEASVDC